jgi:excisionase family DNA binding protein
MEQLLTVKEVSQILQVTEDYVRVMCRKRQIPCMKIGYDWRFDKADIDTWLEEKKQPCIKDIRVVKNLKFKI